MTRLDAPPARTQDDPRQVPLVVAVLGAIAVAFLLFLPVHARSFVDPAQDSRRETVACGNGWHASESGWRSLGSTYRQEATTACGEKRGDRLAQIGATVTATLFVAAFLLALPRRRRSEVEAAQEPETT